HRNLQGNDQVIRMAQPAVGSARDKALAGKNDDARGPTPPQAEDDPDTRGLQQREDAEQKRIDRTVTPEQPQPHEPSRVQRHHEAIMRAAEFHAAASQQARAVAMREPKFREPLRGDEDDESAAFTHEPPRGKENSR